MELERETSLLTEVTTLLQEWEVTENLPNYNAIPTLTKLADKFEKEHEYYFTMNPNPLDERQPLYINPESKFQQALNLLLQKNFIMKLLNEYLCDGSKFNIAGCRLMLALIPWLGTSKLFQLRQDGLLQRLINWATSDIAPLQSYATGVLASVMEIPEIAIAYRDQNHRIVPIMLQRLRALQTSMRLLPVDNGDESKTKRIKLHCDTTDSGVKIKFATQQILILRYVTSMGKNQEFACHVFEHKVLDLILWYINVRETNEVRLGFEALKYLAVLFGNTQFSLYFIERTRLECLLDVPRSSIMDPGVSLCLYSLAQCEKAMERVCLLQKPTLNKLVKYELWLLESSHVSIRCYATMFLSTTFQFRAILEEFDKEDGLEKFQNAIPSPNSPNEDIVGHVCVAYNRYLETHLNIKIESLVETYHQGTDFIIPRQPNDKAYKPSPNKIQEQIESLIQSLLIVAPWRPVDQLLHFGGIIWLLKIIASSTRTEIVQSALDALLIACVNYNVVSALCDQTTVGMTLILKAADGKIIEDSDVRKSALRVIVNCVCAKKFARKVWKTVRMNNGIVVLVKLLNSQTPVSNADCIRALACKALAVLARCMNLPTITAELLQTLMRDPISQEKRHEHVEFQNYALELLQRLGTKPTHTRNDFNSASESNFAVRFARNQMGYESYALNRKLIHSKFYPIQNITLNEVADYCTCVTFLPGNEYLLMSFSNGEIIKIKIGNTNRQSSFFVQEGNCYMINLEPNRDGTLLLGSGGAPNHDRFEFSALWSLNGFDMKLPLFSERYVEFSKTTQDRVIGTRRGLATIYDINTGSPIARLNSNVANMNSYNAATFSRNDDLVLNDGILFDVRTSQQIHKLDKLNRIKYNGVFHPNGLEIVSDSHVWDIRTYRLLKIVPVLHKCQSLFVNTIIYVTDASNYHTAFKIVDSSTYLTIANINSNGMYQRLVVNEFDTQLALFGLGVRSTSTIVRIFDVGRTIDEEDRHEISEERLQQQLDEQAQRYEEQLTELHSVIAELSRKLHQQRSMAIAEEDEASEACTSAHEDSVTCPLEVSELDPPENDFSDFENKADTTIADSPSELPEPKLSSSHHETNELSPFSEVVEPLKQEIINLKAQLLEAQTKLAQFSYETKDDNYEKQINLDSSPESHIEADCESKLCMEEKLDIKYSNIVPIHRGNITSSLGFTTPVTKVAERIKLKRATDGQREVSPNDLVNTDLPTAVAEHIVGDILRQCDAQSEKQAIDFELRRLTAKLEHTRSQNSVLALTLSETKAHCDRLALLCGKYESNAIALRLALGVMDRAIEAYDVLLALLETELALNENNEESVENRIAAESVAKQLLTHLDSYQNTDVLLSPWQNHAFNSPTSEIEEPWTTEQETRLREHVSRLKAERSNIQGTYVTLESPQIEATPIRPASTQEARKMDLEMAVLMQELMGLREDKAELISKLFSLEKDKSTIELKLKYVEGQQKAQGAALKNLQGQLKDTEALLAIATQNKERGYSDAEHAQGVELELIQALAREARLKVRLQELVSTLEQVTKNAEARLLEGREMVHDLNHTNTILAETVDRNHKKYQSRLKKMEQQMLTMVERHNSQVKNLQQRIASLETPPTNSSENSANSVAV